MLYRYVTKVNSWISENKSDLYIAALIFLVGLASFGLGRLSVLWPKKEPIEITIPDARSTIYEETRGDSSSVSQTAAIVPSVQGKYVASKNGTAYHFPWCPGALRIKEENKIWFETKEAAEKAGYKPAGNCEGL